MSILGQYNILGFYSSLTSRAWNKQIATGADEETFRVFLQTNKIPAIQLIVDTATTATVQVFDINDVSVGSAQSMTVESITSGKRLIYLGNTLSGNDDGDYYLRVTINGSTYLYSDVFGWTSNSSYLSKLTKISAVSSNIRLGTSYLLNLTGFTSECYVNAEYLGVSPEAQDEVTERYGTINILYSAMIPKHEFNVYGTEYIQRFLLGLRVLEANGTVTITHNGISYTANDITAEVSDETVPGIAFILKFSFVDHSEIISAYNEIN